MNDDWSPRILEDEETTEAAFLSATDRESGVGFIDVNTKGNRPSVGRPRSRTRGRPVKRALVPKTRRIRITLDNPSSCMVE